MTTTPEEFYRRCNRLFRNPRNELPVEEWLAFLFQEFRPDGAGLDTLFDGVPRADAILPRLQQVYDTAGKDYRQYDDDGEIEEDDIFIVRTSPRMPDDEVRRLSAEWARNIGRVAREMTEAGYESDDEDALSAIIGWADDPPAVTIREFTDRSAPPDLEERGAIFEELLSLTSELLLGVDEGEAPWTELSDAFFHIALDVQLAAWLQWPRFEGCVEVADPFAPYAKLWQAGIDFVPVSPGKVDVWRTADDLDDEGGGAGGDDDHGSNGNGNGSGANAPGIVRRRLGDA